MKKAEKSEEMHNYPSDITHEEYEVIRTDLENARRKTKPRKIDLYDVFCALLYVIKSGCQWRMLPSDFPKWKTVYFYYCIWSGEREDGTTLLSEVLKKIGENNTQRGFAQGQNDIRYY